MNSEFAEVIDEVEAENNDDYVLQAGDECGKNGCEKDLYELTHTRNSRIESVERHPDAPETEIACIHHGVRRSC